MSFKRIRDENFDFKDIPASFGIYAIHPYPIMFHYLVVRELIKSFSIENSNILDPFMGSGVVAGECLIGKRNFIGYDINLLAIIISKVRTTPIKSKILLEALEIILNKIEHRKPEIIESPNIHYWFDESVIEDLSKLRLSIYEIESNEVKDFFKVVFSETVRKVSKAKFNEFTLLKRKDGNNLNVLRVFQEISLKNIGLLKKFYNNFPPRDVNIILEERNILNEIPIDDNSIDLIITSPPCGDSRTTVAYGQFSRLPLRWLWLEENVDNTSLEAKAKPIFYDLPSAILYECIKKILSKGEKRAKEVFSCYNDLYNSIKIISKKVKKNGFVCFVVGNRRVKGIELPTDKISADFFEDQGFLHLKTYVREIFKKNAY